MPTGNPCLDHDCHICCLDTRMTLTEADVARLEAAGHRDFCFVNDDHDLQLLNVEGHCLFLVDRRCSVRDDRPEGCRLYPMILDLSVDRISSTLRSENQNTPLGEVNEGDMLGPGFRISPRNQFLGNRHVRRFMSRSILMVMQLRWISVLAFRLRQTMRPNLTIC